MAKNTFLVLCMSLCMMLTLPLEAFAVARQEGTNKVHTNAPENRNSGKTGLLADQLEIKKKISNHRRLRDTQLKKQLEREQLESPSEELYGYNSWGTTVNPFAGESVNIPEEYNINLDGFVMPLSSRRVTSHYGYRPSFGRMHYGTDFGLSIGDTIRAVYSGKVRIASYEGGGYGNYIVIRHPNGLETVYGHLSRRIASEGTIVRAGDPIGLGGNTGRSTGPHLHFEARFMGLPLNPNELFDFEYGTPRTDVYTFRHRNHRRKLSSQEALAARDRARKASEERQAEAAKGGKEVAQVSTHKVKRGETLYSIASQYDISVDKLKKLNGIRKGSIKVGKTIRVS